MKYAFLLYGNETDNIDPSSPDFPALMGHYMAFGEQAGERIIAGEPLEPTATATTLNVRDGVTTTTDGPFAETKEQLGGFYVLECENLDEALSWAAKIPAAWNGHVEVRPIPDFG